MMTKLKTDSAHIRTCLDCKKPLRHEDIGCDVFYIDLTPKGHICQRCCNKPAKLRRGLTSSVNRGKPAFKKSKKRRIQGGYLEALREVYGDGNQLAGNK